MRALLQLDDHLAGRIDEVAVRYDNNSVTSSIA
jgi:hypothetical protein